MKCKNCGADYSSYELKCPYCGTPNPIGLNRKKQKDDIDRKFTMLKWQELIRSESDIHVKVLGRAVAAMIVLTVICIVVTTFFGVRQEMNDRPEHSRNQTKSEIEADIQECVDTENYRQIQYILMDNDVPYNEYMEYRALSRISENMENYRDAKVNLQESSVKYKDGIADIDSYKFRCENVVNYAFKVIQYTYRDVYSNNQLDDPEDIWTSYYEECKEELKASLQYEMKFTPEEIEKIFEYEGEYVYSEDEEYFKNLIIDRWVGNNEQDTVQGNESK